jgi:ABC-type lipoprotein release transport system permease subunit
MLFIIYSVITYIIMLVIALIGTVIPVIRAARTLPAKALREL